MQTYLYSGESCADLASLSILGRESLGGSHIACKLCNLKGACALPGYKLVSQHERHFESLCQHYIAGLDIEYIMTPYRALASTLRINLWIRSSNASHLLQNPIKYGLGILPTGSGAHYDVIHIKTTWKQFEVGQTHLMCTVQDY